MPNLGFPELIGLLMIALLLFGPKRLPELGKSLGEAITNFKRTFQKSGEVDEQTKSSDDDCPQS